MRYSLLYFFLLFTGSISFGQSTSASDTTKVSYSEIVKVDSTNRFDLYKKAATWASRQGFTDVEEDAMGGRITARNKFDVFTDKGVLAKPNGFFTHDVAIEVKEGRYRYTFNNFLYTHYQMDRNLKLVAVKGTKAIEETKAPGWKKQWAKNKMQVKQKTDSYTTSLKEAMKYTPPKPAATAKPKEEW